MEQPWPQPNPALRELEFLVGEWDMELSEAAFLPSMSDTVKGRVSFRWVEDGAFLQMQQREKIAGPPMSVWNIGRDETSGRYAVLYYDGRGVSRIYEMSLENGTWKMWRDAPGFAQRYEAAISSDHNTMHARWEKNVDGSTWLLDFKMTYTRIG